MYKLIVRLWLILVLLMKSALLAIVIGLVIGIHWKAFRFGFDLVMTYL